jgi:hypothetical protein
LPGHSVVVGIVVVEFVSDFSFTSRFEEVLTTTLVELNVSAVL